MSTVPEFMVPSAETMEVGNTKRGLETEGLMHEEEEDQWDMIHDEVLHQLTAENLVGTPHQQGEPIPDGSCWWPAISYDAVDPMVTVPARAGTVEKWGRTCADKLPKLYKLGVGGLPYDSLVKQAMTGHTALASYLGWLQSQFNQKYQKQGPTSQGIDLAGYLAKIKFVVPVDGDGFQRRFAS